MEETHTFFINVSVVEDGVRPPASVELGKHLDLDNADRGDIERQTRAWLGTTSALA